MTLLAVSGKKKKKKSKIYYGIQLKQSYKDQPYITTIAGVTLAYNYVLEFTCKWPDLTITSKACPLMSKS